MVVETGVVRATNPVSLHPVRMRNGRTVTKDRAIPADGHSVAKLYSDSAELGASVRFCSMDIRKDEEPVGTATGYLFGPNTEALGRVMHIKVRRIPKVDTHVDGIPDALAALIFLTSPPATSG